MVAPGDSASPLFEVTFSARDVLADSLPAGRYRMTAIPHVIGLRRNELSAGEVELRPAG
jgi:hypothetical protein